MELALEQAAEGQAGQVAVLWTDDLHAGDPELRASAIATLDLRHFGTVAIRGHPLLIPKIAAERSTGRLSIADPVGRAAPPNRIGCALARASPEQRPAGSVPSTSPAVPGRPGAGHRR